MRQIPNFKMKISLILLFILLANVSTIWCQFSISGKVISKQDKEPLPGVTVVEKGTKNGTLTTMDGSFSLTVASANSILVFSSVGAVTQEYPLKGQDHIFIKMKWDCNIDFFDYKKIRIYANSGVINNPVGGQFEFIFPPFFKLTSFQSGISYQTNLRRNDFLNCKIELNHLVATCDFDMDVKWHYRKVSLGNSFNSRVYSFETVLDFHRLLTNYNLNFIIGYGKLDYKRYELTKNQSSGPLIGLGTFVSRPLYVHLVAKASIFKNRIEYQVEMTRQFNNINTFIKFYKLASFTELSLGCGIEIPYRLKKQKKNI